MDQEKVSPDDSVDEQDPNPVLRKHRYFGNAARERKLAFVLLKVQCRSRKQDDLCWEQSVVGSTQSIVAAIASLRGATSSCYDGIVGL